MVRLKNAEIVNLILRSSYRGCGDNNPQAVGKNLDKRSDGSS